MMVPSVNARVAHLVIVIVILVACFTDSSFSVRPRCGVQFADPRQGALWASRKTLPGA
jgi:hypothetical protein